MVRTLKIVHVINCFYPQIGYQETFLAKEHAKMNNDTYVITSDYFLDSVLHAEDSVKLIRRKKMIGTGLFQEDGINVWRLKSISLTPHAVLLLGLRKKIQELEPDIVIVHGIVNISAITLSKLKKKTDNFKLLYDDHMTFDLSTSISRFLYPFFKWIFSPLIQETADALIAVGKPSKSFMMEKYGIPAERIKIISMGADDTLFKFDASARQNLRKELSLNKEDIVFIYTGKILPKKRLSLLIDAVYLLRDYKQVKVLFVGQGPIKHIEELRQNIKNKNLEDRFIWHDAVPNKDLYKFYSVADVAVWPAGASISIFEALACSLPIIVSDSPNINEMTYITNQITYQGLNPSNLAIKMEKLLDPKLRKSMGSNGRRLVEENLNWRNIAAEFIKSCSDEQKKSKIRLA